MILSWSGAPKGALLAALPDGHMTMDDDTCMSAIAVWNRGINTALQGSALCGPMDSHRCPSDIGAGLALQQLQVGTSTKGGTEIIVHALAATLAEGLAIFTLDMKTALNSIKRAAMAATLSL